MAGKHASSPGLAPASHADPDGPLKGWEAADVDPAEYSSDDYAAQFPVVDGEAEEPRGLIAGATANITRDNLRTIASRTGRQVIEAWSDRNAGLMGTVVGVVMHHTGSAWSAAGVAPTLQIVREGRSDLLNALCTFYIDKAGTVYLVTEKVAWHAGQGAYRGITDGNGHFLGIEAESDGVHWTPETVDAYVALVAEIVRFLGADPATWAIRHATWATPPGRKTDFAGLNEADFRARITARLNGQETDMPLTADEKTELVNRTADAIINRVIVGKDVQLWQVLGAIYAKTYAERHDLGGRPVDGMDDLFGHVLSTEARVKALATAPSAAVNVDPAALAAALLSDEASVARLGDAIAAGLAKRVGNG